MMHGIFELNEETYHQYNKIITNAYVFGVGLDCECVFDSGNFQKIKSSCFMWYVSGIVSTGGPAEWQGFVNLGSCSPLLILCSRLCLACHAYPGCCSFIAIFRALETFFKADPDLSAQICPIAPPLKILPLPLLPFLKLGQSGQSMPICLCVSDGDRRQGTYCSCHLSPKGILFPLQILSLSPPRFKLFKIKRCYLPVLSILSEVMQRG